MTGEKRAPSFDAVLVDLGRVRERGVGKIRSLDLPALTTAAKITDLAADDATEPAAITTLLRQAVDTLGGGSLQEAAEYLLGLYRSTALWSSRMRREHAAEQFGVAVETFRKRPEKDLLGQIAEAILQLCHDARMRQTRHAMEFKRHPADSRLAVQWVERFEAYYRVWTPTYALAANLEAALEVYTHEPSDHLPWDPDSEQAYDPVEQARNYARSALYNLVQYQLEVRRFQSRHGGLWLLSDPQLEEDVASAVYRISWHNDITYEEESFLRRHLADSRHQETEHFWNVIQGIPEGVRIHDKWQAMVRKGVGLTTDKQRQAGQAWLTIAACHDYTRMIDEDWLRIADWYRPGTVPEKTVSGETLYDALVRKVGEFKGEAPDEERLPNSRRAN